MQVLGVEHIGEIQFPHAHLVHRPGVGQDVALLALRQQHRQARRFTL